MDMSEAQLLPVEGSQEAFDFFVCDILITALFVLELLLNIFAHSANNFVEFYTRGSNWFDVFVIVAQLLSLIIDAVGVAKIPGLKLLRVLRIFRVLRLISRLKGLNRLCQAVGFAMAPVCNAFLLLIICTSMYSILGTHIFKSTNPKYFKQFATSMYTMFQVFTGDGWSDISRTLFEDAAGEQIDFGVAIFFISYILIAGIILFNVVVAVLLDEFIKFIGAEKEKEHAEAEAAEEKLRIKGCLDPLTKTLVLFEDEQDLVEKIEDIFQYLDNDDSGGLNYRELCHGLKNMKLRNQISSERIQGIHFTYDDFEVLTEQGKLLGPQGEFSKHQFTQMMMGELKRYGQRHLRNSVLLSTNHEFIPTVILNKLSNLEILREMHGGSTGVEFRECGYFRQVLGGCSSHCFQSPGDQVLQLGVDVSVFFDLSLNGLSQTTESRRS